MLASTTIKSLTGVIGQFLKNLSKRSFLRSQLMTYFFIIIYIIIIIAINFRIYFSIMYLQFQDNQKVKHFLIFLVHYKMVYSLQ